MALEKLVNVEVVDSVNVVSFGSSAATLHGKLVDDVSATLLAAARNERHQLLVDLEHVEFFNSTLIELLVRCWKIIRSAPEGQFGLCNLQPYCHEILEVTNLTHVWQIFPNRAAGIATMREQGKQEQGNSSQA